MKNLLSVLWMLAAPAAVQAASPPVQSLLLRSVTVTCKLDESIAFYRDILGQEVIEDVKQDAVRAQSFLDVTPNAEVRFVVMKGSGIYPGGEIIGGRVAFMGIKDPGGNACKDVAKMTNHRGVQGSHIHPHRVANIDEISSRAKAAGVQILFGPQNSSSGLSRNMMMFDPNGLVVEVFEINTSKNQK